MEINASIFLQHHAKIDVRVMPAMKTIGVVGGIGPESTITYYRLLVASGHSAVLIHSVDVQLLIGAMVRKDLTFVADYLVDAVAVLEKAGASVGLIAANTPHVVFDEVQRRSALPLVSIVQATCDHVRASGFKCAGLLGTRFTMEGGFYPAVFDAAGIQLVAPASDDLSYIHDIYINELLKNRFLPETRLKLLRVIDRLIDQQGVDSIILAGTELPLVLAESSHRGVQLLDTAVIHVHSTLNQV